MKLALRSTNSGIEISLGERENDLLKPCPLADQLRPRNSYVYAHVSSIDEVFYIGKGKDRRAWSKDRHPYWHRYVENHLKGEYKILILKDGLSEEESEQTESEWMSQCGESLVNWGNMSRPLDMEACDRYWKLRKLNDLLIAEARNDEKANPEAASTKYLKAIEAYGKYNQIRFDQGSGLVAQLMAEEREEIGEFGPVEILDRLTMCLIKIGKVGEAKQFSDQFFLDYRASSSSPRKLAIEKRIAKAMSKKS